MSFKLLNTISFESYGSFLEYSFFRSVTSIRGELVPFLVRKQFSKTFNTQNPSEDLESQKKEDLHASLGTFPLWITSLLLNSFILGIFLNWYREPQRWRIIGPPVPSLQSQWVFGKSPDIRSVINKTLKNFHVLIYDTKHTSYNSCVFNVNL